MSEDQSKSAELNRKRRLFWVKVDRNGPIPDHVPELGQCWVWTAGKLGKGYGAFRGLASERMGAHRFSWILANGPVPEGGHVLHKCDNRLCVRPDHLFLGTALENMHDMLAKGRSRYTPLLPLIGLDNHKTKLNEQDVRAIRSLYAAGGVTHQALADKFGISRPHVTGIINGAQRKYA